MPRIFLESMRGIATGPLARSLVVTLVALSGSACTAIRVEPIPAGESIPKVCIVENPKVDVPDFVTVVRAGFRRHGIPTELCSLPVPEHCEFTLTYDARKSWDMVSYLSHAELRFEQRGDQIAYATYHLRNRGGYALYSKWKSTEKKISPIMDRLLEAYGEPLGNGD